jgi:hypothetical protein
MPAYNVVAAAEETACPVCGLLQRRPVQFTFGETWQLEYEIGDRIKWGANDSGEPGHAKVAVAGYGEPCARCGASDPVDRYDIIIEDDTITSVAPSENKITYDPEDWTTLD